MSTDYNNNTVQPDEAAVLSACCGWETTRIHGLTMKAAREGLPGPVRRAVEDAGFEPGDVV
jgi:hypothetical protein